MNGTAPSKLIADHMSATIRKPSRLRIACESRRNGQPQHEARRDRAIANVTEKCSKLAVAVVERDRRSAAAASC